jgi:tetratricopeptide (TPR) repeat protein
MRIELAKEPDFALSDAIRVCPSRREVLFASRSIVVEPRVMQVLVALHRASGTVVSRDDLIEACWEGRIVGDDAINRVLSRLRRLAEDDLAGAFRIETITRVGYRMTLAGESGGDGLLIGPAGTPARAWPRRAVIAGGAAAVLAAGGVGGWLLLDRRPDGAAELERQAQDAIDYGTPDRLTQAIGLLRELAGKEPGRASNWSLLAVAYCRAAQQAPPAQASQLLVRAREAQQRALAIDPEDSDANAVPTAFEGFFGRWSAYESKIAALDRRFPDNRAIASAHTGLMANVGFLEDALARGERIDTGDRIVPGLVNGMVLGLANAGRLDEADQLITRAYAVMPQHYVIWFTRFRYLLYSSRVSEAKAMLAEGVAKPIGIPAWNMKLCRLEAEALETRSPQVVEQAIAAYAEAAKIGGAFLPNAATFSATMGHVEEAMQFAERYLLSTDAALPRADYSPEQGIYRPDDYRQTFFLFNRHNAPLRGHPRFRGLLERIGLEQYWRDKKRQPDFRIPG